MNFPVVVRAEAQADLLAARDYYDQQQPGLGQEFANAVDELFVRISDRPGMYAVVLRNVRRAKLRRFPYLVYYRVLADRVEVIGILHGSRDARVWRQRA